MLASTGLKLRHDVESILPKIAEDSDNCSWKKSGSCLIAHHVHEPASIETGAASSKFAILQGSPPGSKMRRRLKEWAGDRHSTIAQVNEEKEDRLTYGKTC